MPSAKRSVVIGSAVALLSLSGAPAHAQGWVSRPLVSWRSAAGWRYPAMAGLAGGEVVSTGSFAAGRGLTATMTAAQWQEMVTAQARQTPTLTAAQWNQLVTAQARQPLTTTLTPAQQMNVLRAAAARQQQQQLNELIEALRQAQQQQNAQPPPPHP